MSRNRRPYQVALLLTAGACAVSVIACLAVYAAHGQTWLDLEVYRDAGRLARTAPGQLYLWHLMKGVQFTYPPFAAALFSGMSLVPWSVLHWSVTALSVAAIPLVAWLTLGALGHHGYGRTAATLGVTAVAVWLEPVQRAIHMGQIEPLLLLLVVWDLTRSDDRRWKGAGIGLAAGIKLVPLIFIPYLLLVRKFRQAAVATAAFAVTIAIGIAVLPKPSRSWWLQGLFFRPGRTGGVASLVNQSILGMLARTDGGVTHARPMWIAVSVLIGCVGLAAAGMLTRTGQPVAGWVLVGITSVLISPISWDHHWIWIVPLLALLVSLMMRAHGALRSGYMAAAAAITAVYGAWPNWYSGPQAFVSLRGALGWFILQPASVPDAHVHGWLVLSWNLFVIGGCVIFLAMVTATALAWRRPVSEPSSGGPDRTGLEGLPVRPRAGGSVLESS